MSAFGLLLGTRRLRREIAAHALQLGRDIENEQFARAQLRQTFVNRVTSPLGLLSAVGAGFVAGKMGSRPSGTKHAAQAVAGAMTLAIAAVRSVALQAVLPMAIEWIQSKFAHRKAEEETAPETEAQDDIALLNQK